MGLSVSVELLSALARGALVVTGKERVARTLRHGWDRYQAGLGRTVWEPAQAQSWQAWTAELWRRLLLEGGASALRMNGLQEHSLWCRVLSDDASVHAPSGQDALADLAAQAWQRLCAYNGQGRLRRMASTLREDPATFARWARTFEELCGRELLLSEAALEAELVRAVLSGRLATIKGEMCLVGFDRLTPAQHALLEALSARGTTITHHTVQTASAGQVVAARDEIEEMLGAARWMRLLLEKDPSATLGLIVPDLARERPLLESILREVLAPELEAITAGGTAAPYEFSLGRTLAHEPLVQSALDLLRWAAGPLPLERVSRLLLSPHFASGTARERGCRAEFDAGPLRSSLRLQPHSTISDLRRDLSRRASAAPTLSRALEQMEAAQSLVSDGPSRSFGEWTEWIRKWLEVARWAGSAAALSSPEYQVRERWEETLDRIASLDFSGDRVTLEGLLEILTRVGSETIVAPESQAAPVQVMGPLEAAGSLFDGLWAMRCGELSWPPRVAVDPLLPWALQRELHMPGSTSEVDRAAAEQLTARVAAAGSAVVLSYARTTPLSGPQRASYLLHSLGLQEIPLSTLLPPPKPRVAIPLERQQDRTSVVPLPDAVQRGGAHVLQLQAACGFRAFAEMRLGSSAIEQRSLGFSVRERGSIVHETLESFWSEVSGQRELRAMSDVQRSAAIERAVAKSLERAFHRQRDAWDGAYLAIQKTRLTRLLGDWLAVELDRPEFSVAMREAERRDVTVGPLRLSLRVDRIDLVDGQQVVLDYKTGPAETSSWLGERPDEPQVPLYAILAQQAGGDGQAAPLGAVGFAQVRAGRDMKLRGLEATPGILARPSANARQPTMDTDSFKAQVIRWREVLEQLAVQFAAGEAQIRPKQYPSTCERCGQRLLCRIDASAFAGDLYDTQTATEDQHVEG